MRLPIVWPLILFKSEKSTDFAFRDSIPSWCKSRGGQLTVTVLFTSPSSTLNALKTAAELAQGLGASIRILVPHIVPYPLPLKSPPVDSRFTNRRLQTMFGRLPIETRVELFLCRDLSDCLSQALEPNSLIVVGGVKRWWRNREIRLAKLLRRQGHHAIFVCDGGKGA